MSPLRRVLLACAGAVTLAACDDLMAPDYIRFSSTVYDLVAIDGKGLPDTGFIRLPPFDTIVVGEVQGGTVIFGDATLLWETKYQTFGDSVPHYRHIFGQYGQNGDTALFLLGRWAVRKGDTLTLLPNANDNINSWLSGKVWKLVKRPQ